MRPNRLPRNRAWVIDEMLESIAAAVGEGDEDAHGLGAQLLREVPSLRAIVVVVEQREVRWTRGAGA